MKVTLFNLKNPRDSKIQKDLSIDSGVCSMKQLGFLSKARMSEQSHVPI
jgi:hypothetical protein